MENRFGKFLTVVAALFLLGILAVSCGTIMQTAPLINIGK